MAAVDIDFTDAYDDAKEPCRVRAVSLAELLALDFPPRENLLSPWLPRQGLAMIHAPCGVGKTFCALNVAYAVASGGSFLGWSAPAARNVLFVDGEMPGRSIQERLAAITAGAEKEVAASLRIVTPDLQHHGLPDLSTTEGQASIDAEVTDNTDLIIIDNLSSLVRSGRENEAESWQPLQTWALRHRAEGRSILFVHHSGKSGSQRGTSRKGDVLDTILALRRPPDYSPRDGAVFEVHFEKARGIYGDDVEPFEARLVVDAEGRPVWNTRSVDQSTFNRVVELQRQGLSQKDIAEELDLTKSTVSYHMRRAREQGAGGGDA